MPSHRRRQSALLAKSTELAFAAPYVVAHRLARMAIAGDSPSARDRKEFSRMGSEKILAFNQSWYAMWLEAMRANQTMTMSLYRSCWTVGQRMMLAGLGPVHRGAVANAKRLRRVRLR